MPVMLLESFPNSCQSITVPDDPRQLLLQEGSKIPSEPKEKPRVATLGCALDAPPRAELIIRRLEVFYTYRHIPVDTHTGHQYIAAQLLAGPSSGIDCHLRLIMEEDGSYHIRHVQWLSAPSSVPNGRLSGEQTNFTPPVGSTIDRRLKRLWFSGPGLWLDDDDCAFEDYDVQNDSDFDAGAYSNLNDGVEPLTLSTFLLLVDSVNEHRKSEGAGSSCRYSFIDEVVGALEFSHYPSSVQNCWNGLECISREGEGASSHAFDIATIFFGKQALSEQSKTNFITSIKAKEPPQPFDKPSTVAAALCEERQRVISEQSQLYSERMLLAKTLKQLLMEVEAVTDALDKLHSTVDISYSGFTKDDDLMTRTADTIRVLEQR